MTSRKRSFVLAVVLTASSAYWSLPATAAPVPEQRRSTYVVTLRDQLPRLPAEPGSVEDRAARAKQEQDAVLRRLGGPAVLDVHHFRVGNVVTARITAGQARQLALDPAVASVAAPQLLSTPSPSDAAAATIGPRLRQAATPPPVTVPAKTCTGTRAKPQLEPEALQTISARSDDPADSATAAAAGYDGAGVRVGIIADILDPHVPDFIRPDGTRVVTDYVDVTGQGPDPSGGGGEMFGDASAIGAQGRTTYDLAHDVDPTHVAYPGGHCYVRVVGAAPGAQITAIDAGPSGGFDDIDLLQAVDYAVGTAHVDVLNESLGGFAVPDATADNAVEAANSAATAAGTTVVVASGDAGVNSTIGNPGAQADVIRVGASLTNRSYVQTGKGLADSTDNPTSSWRNDNVSPISSSGATQDARTVDLIAPGDSNWAVCKADPKFSECTNLAGKPSSLQLFAGTSQACPLTSATAALVIQAYRHAHRGASPTPAVVKQIITASADDQNLPGWIQGAGRLDAGRAVRLAASSPGPGATAAADQPAAAVTDRTQLTVSGQPGSVHQRTLHVTNAGGRSAAISVSTRTAVPTSDVDRAVRLDPTASDPLTTGEFGGAQVVHRRVPIDVPTGTDHVTVAIAWPRSSARVPLVMASLFDPDGTFVANSNPQSSSNADTGAVIGPQYSQLTVRTPVAGQYVADVYTFAKVGFSGTVRLSAQFFDQRPAAAATPASATLAPGASTDVDVPVTVPTDSGDTEQDVVVKTGAKHAFVVPVIVRSVLPVGDGPARFAGTVYGGNGRPQSPVQTATYSITVPAGHRDLSVDTTTNCGCKLESYLVDPYGQVQSDVTNRDPKTGVVVPGIALTAAAPTPGRWRLIVTIDDVSGRTTRSRFTGVAVLDHRHVTARRLPDDPRLTLTRNVTRTVAVTVTNTSPMPIGVEIDPRTRASVTAPLVSAKGSHRLAYPGGQDAVVVPFDTTDLAVTATASRAVRAGLQPQSGGGISLVSDAGTNPRIDYTAAHGINPGAWIVSADPADVTSAVVKGTATYRATATTAGFDRTVTTAGRDTWLDAVDASAPDDHPLFVAPGASKSIAVRIRPTASAGTVVEGSLLVIQTPGNALGAVLARLPYSYTVTGPVSPVPAGAGETPIAASDAGSISDTGPEATLPLTVLAGLCFAVGLALCVAGRTVASIGSGRHRRR